MLGENFAVEVGDDDAVARFVALGNDPDVMEGVLDADFVDDFVRADGA